MTESTEIEATFPGSVGFVGAGRVARIMLGGWARAARLPGAVLVTDPDPAAVSALTAAVPSAIVTEVSKAASADVVFVAVHPPVAVATLTLLRDLVPERSVVVSLIPSVPLLRVGAELGGNRPLARMIPNAPSIVGAGFNPIAYGPGMTATARADLAALLEPLGAYPEVPDDRLEAYAVLTAMGPTYLWPQLYALADVGQRMGLDPGAALDALVAMVDGALLTMTDADLTPDEVQDLIPVRPLAEPVAAMRAAYGEVLTGLHARLTGRGH